MTDEIYNLGDAPYCPIQYNPPAYRAISLNGPINPNILLTMGEHFKTVWAILALLARFDSGEAVTIGKVWELIALYQSLPSQVRAEAIKHSKQGS